MISCQKEPALLTDLIKDGDKIVLGVSGGPDSMCMLDMMRRLKEEKNINFEIYVAHINHMIREEAINRINSQMPLERKKDFANIIIENNDILPKTKEQVDLLIDFLNSNLK